MMSGIPPPIIYVWPYFGNIRILMMDSITMPILAIIEFLLDTRTTAICFKISRRLYSFTFLPIAHLSATPEQALLANGHPAAMSPSPNIIICLRQHIMIIDIYTDYFSQYIRFKNLLCTRFCCQKRCYCLPISRKREKRDIRLGADIHAPSI